MANSPQRQSRLYAVKEHARGHIARYIEEVNILIDHPVGVNGDITGRVMELLEEIARYEEHIKVIEAHFEA